MLSEFYIVVEEFERTLNQCCKGIAESDAATSTQGHRMGDLGRDMINFSDSFLRAHIEATMWSVDGAYEAEKLIPRTIPDHDALMAYISGERHLTAEECRQAEDHFEQSRRATDRLVHRSKSRAKEREDAAVADLKTAYKAYFFFIRAFQDAGFRVMVDLNGDTPGEGTRIRECIKEKKHTDLRPVIADISGYIDWFTEFKSKRDKIKSGANFSLRGPQWDVGIGFNEHPEKGRLVVSVGGENNTYRIGDLIVAFQYSTRLVEVVLAMLRRCDPTVDVQKIDE